MKNTLKYLLAYVLLVIILTLSFSNGLFLLDYNFIFPIVLLSMILALFPIIIFYFRNKPKLMIVLFVVFVAITAYLHIQTSEGKFSTWFKEEQTRQFIVLYILFATSLITAFAQKRFFKKLND